MFLMWKLCWSVELHSRWLELIGNNRKAKGLELIGDLKTETRRRETECSRDMNLLLSLELVLRKCTIYWNWSRQQVAKAWRKYWVCIKCEAGEIRNRSLPLVQIKAWFSLPIRGKKWMYVILFVCFVLHRHIFIESFFKEPLSATSKLKYY